MDIVEMTTISSKGQVVLPQAVRRMLKLEEGERLIVLCSKDGVLLKRIEAPLKERFHQMLQASRAWAKKVHLTQKDVNQAIHNVRKKRHHT